MKKMGRGRGLGVLMGCAALAAFAPPAAAGNLEAGRSKARMCAVCHGLDGIGKNPTVPNLAGESRLYLAKQLKAFRSGERTHEQMTIIAKGLSDEDIDNLATYYSAIEITATPPK